MKVRGSMRCPSCGARWSLVGDPKEDDELCPNCHGIGELRHEGDFRIGVASPGAESQELPPLPMPQQIIRLATKLYIERVKEFGRSLDDKQRESVSYAVEVVLRPLKLFSDFLERAGLPLEENVEMAAETVKPENLRELNKEIEMTLNRATAAHKVFWQLFGKEMRS